MRTVSCTVEKSHPIVLGHSNTQWVVLMSCCAVLAGLGVPPQIAECDVACTEASVSSLPWQRAHFGPDCYCMQWKRHCSGPHADAGGVYAPSSCAAVQTCRPSWLVSGPCHDVDAVAALKWVRKLECSLLTKHRVCRSSPIASPVSSPTHRQSQRRPAWQCQRCAPAASMPHTGHAGMCSAETSGSSFSAAAQRIPLVPCTQRPQFKPQ